MYRKILTYGTVAKAEIRPITEDLRRCLRESSLQNGTLLVYSLHTTLGILIQETAEAQLCEDILDYLGFVIEDEGELYKHRGALHPRSNGADTDCNAPSHLRQMLVNQNVVLDVCDGELALGPWQDVALAEFDGPRAGRQVLVKIWPDPCHERRLEVDRWEQVFTRRGPGEQAAGAGSVRRGEGRAQVVRER
jgi:secondary thiamine-phosphate synthase enzyme